MKAVINHLSFEFKSVTRDKTLLLMNYLFPMAFYFMLCMIMPGIYPEFKNEMIPGMILFALIVSTLLGMPNPMVGNREKGIYRSYKIYGVPLKSVFIIPVITTIVHITLVACILLFCSTRLFKAAMPHSLLSFFSVYAVVLFAFSGLGVLIGVCSPNDRFTILLAQLIFLPSMLVGGIIMPASILSESVRKIAMLLPTSYATNALGAVYTGQQAAFSLSASLWILGSGGVLAYALAAYLFSWDKKSNGIRNLLGLAGLIPYVLGMILL